MKQRYSVVRPSGRLNFSTKNIFSGKGKGKYILALIFSMLWMLQGLWAQNATAIWPLTSNATPSVTGTLTAAAMTRGGGLTNVGHGTNGYNARGWNATTLSNANTANDYVQFSITVGTANTMTLTNLALKTMVPAAQANARFQVQYSFTSSFSTPVNIGGEIIPAAAMTTTTLDPANLVIPAGATLYIRVYAWGLSATTTDFYIKDLQVQGSVCSAVAISYPSPGAYCKYPGATATPTRTGTSGGVYTATTGLVINSTTGVIDVAASVAGIHTVTYTVAGGSGCGNVVATKTVVINDLPTAFTLTGPDGSTGAFCTNGTPATFNLSGSQEGVTYTFTPINPGGNTPPGQSFNVEGVGGTLEFVLTPDGKWSYKVMGEDDETGCTNTMEGYLTAVDGPTITSQPEAARAVCAGSATALTLNVNNATSLNWQVSTNGGSSWSTITNGAPYAITKASNHSTTTLTISNLTTAMNGYSYRVVMGGPSACPINYSTGTTLSVSALTVITTQPVSKAVCNNSTLQLSVSAAQGTSYQWYKNGSQLVGATASTYSKTFNAATDAGTYYVMVYGTCGSVRSNDANINNNTNPTATTWVGPAPSASGINGTAWEQAANWSCGVPTRTIDAIIPADILDGYPTIKATVSGEVRNLTIQSGMFGGFLNVEGKLQLFGTVSNSGVFEAGNGTIEYAGTATQSIEANTFAGNTVKNLVISNNVTLKGPLDLTGTLSFGAVNNKTFTTNDHLALKSSAAATARVADITNNGSNAGNTITGNVAVERFIPAYSNRRWRLVTAPVKGVSINKAWQEGRTWNGTASEASGYGTLITGQTQGSAEKANAAGFDFWSAIAGGGASVRKYVGSSSATSNIDAAFYPVDNTNTASFTSHEAYLLFVRGDRTVSAGSTVGSALLRAKGPLKQETSYTIPVAATQSHTLIGNPYASPINFRKLYADNKTRIQSYYWTWQAGLGTGVGGYVLMFPNGEGGWEPVPAIDGVGTTDPLIGSGEGFFLVPAATATTNNAITLKEVHKDGDKPSIAVFRQADAAPAKIRINLFTGLNGQKVLLDGVQARFSETEKTAMAKAVNTGENLSIYKGGKDLIVAGGSTLQAGDSLQLRFWNLVVRKYTLELAGNRFPANLAAVLFDRFLAKETPIRLSAEGLAYEFAVTADAASRNAQRFVIRFKSQQVLPVTLLSFTAKEKSSGGSVDLAWKVTGESNIQSYMVERSADGSGFTALQTVTPTSQPGEQLYQAVDGKPAAVNHYRVKIVEATGSFRYSDVVTVRVARKEGPATVYPNPVRGSEAFLRLNNKPAGTYNLTFYNPAGQQLAAKEVLHTGGSATISLPIESVWPAGIYSLRLTAPGGMAETIIIHVSR